MATNSGALRRWKISGLIALVVSSKNHALGAAASCGTTRTSAVSLYTLLSGT